MDVIAIFDIGKTNKKLFLFDERYHIVLERSAQLPQTVDEDGDACEDVHGLAAWVLDTFKQVCTFREFRITAINFSSYGASFVHLDEHGVPVTPLYNYTKPFPEDLRKKFYDTYGGEPAFSMFTASPVLGHLNSGMQLYWLRHKRPEVFKKIKYSLHLPQYIAYLFTGKATSDLTSIGCHTNLWNFAQNSYHDWVKAEGVLEKLAPIVPPDSAMACAVNNQQLVAGTGLHDSSAALIPYLISFPEPFVLLSTGTWCISLNPFTDDPLTTEELQKDCLCYLSYKGNPVKASRLFSGYEHEQQAKRLADHFHTAEDAYKQLHYDPALAAHRSPGYFEQPDLSVYPSYAEAYSQMVSALVNRQVASTRLVLNNRAVHRIFVDGGFSKNSIFMHTLAAAFPAIEVYAASMAQASALGAAMVIHPHWNTKPLLVDVMNLKYYGGR